MFSQVGLVLDGALVEGFMVTLLLADMGGFKRREKLRQTRAVTRYRKTPNVRLALVPLSLEDRRREHSSF